MFVFMYVVHTNSSTPDSAISGVIREREEERKLNAIDIYWSSLEFNFFLLKLDFPMI